MADRAAADRDFDHVDYKWLDEWLRRRSSGRRAARPKENESVVSFGSIAGLVVALALAVWLTAGAWGGRPPSGEDTMPHLLRAQFALSHLLPHFRVDGWHPAFILGYEEFLLIGPAFTWAVGLVRVLSLGLLSTPGAFKVVFIGSFVVLPLAVAFFARSFGLSARGAAVAAILTLAVNNPSGGVGLQGLFNVGLVVHQFGGIFFFLTMGGILRLIDRPTARWTIFSAAAGAALLLSHGISVILLAPLVAIVLAVHLVPLTSTERRSERFAVAVRREVRAELRRLQVEQTPATAAPGEQEDEADALPPQPRPELNLRRLVLAGALSALLAACVLVPFLAHRNLRGGYTGWGTPPFGQRISQIWHGQILFRPGVAPIVLLGLVYGVYRAYEGRRYALVMVVAPVAYLILSHAALHEWPSNVIAVQLPNRGLGYVGVLLVLPLAALIDRLGTKDVAGSALAIAIAAAVVIVPIGNYRSLARQNGDPAPQLRAAAAELTRIVPDGARFMTERDFPGEIDRTKVVDPDRWLAWASGRNTLNNFNVESSTVGGPAFEAEHVRDRPADVVADAISRLGVTDVVTVSDAGARRLGSSPRFTEVWTEPPLAIFSVSARPGQPDPSALLTANVPLAARLTSAAPEALTIRFQASRAGRADVAVAWSPKWHARIDGRAVHLVRGTDSLLAFDMPSGAHRLDLRFHEDVWDLLGLLISLATALGLVAWAILRRRSKKGGGAQRAERVPIDDAPMPARAAATSAVEGALIEGRSGGSGPPTDGRPAAGEPGATEREPDRRP